MATGFQVTEQRAKWWERQQATERRLERVEPIREVVRIQRGGFRTQQIREQAARQQALNKYTELPWEKPGLKRHERVIAFLEELNVTSGVETGSKLRLRGFQRDFIQDVYTEKNGIRPIRTAVFSIARKNGKSQLAAGLALCHLSGPEAESRGEIYSCANDRFQASKIFHEMVAIIYSNEYLRARINITHNFRQITDLVNGSLYVALTREVKTKMGLNPSFVIYDEYGQAPDDELYRAMDSAMGARKEPLLMIISTQASNDAAPLSRLIDYGLKVKSKDIDDPTFHLTLCCSDPDDDPWSEATWRKANPALGDFRSIEDVQRLAAQAQKMPGQENSFRNLILNQRVEAYTPFITVSAWKACGGDSTINEGAKVYAALDLGSTQDMSALILIAEDVEGAFHVQSHFWLPGNVEQRESEDRAPYEEWVHQGYLNAIGEATDPKVIALKIAELNGKYDIQCIAFDRWRMNDLKRELDAIGCNIPLIPHGQGFRDISPAVDVLERMIIQKRVKHSNHPVLTMNASNAIITKDPAGNRKLDKAKSKGRIDGIVALAMAFSAAMIKPQVAKIDMSSLIG